MTGGKEKFTILKHHGHRRALIQNSQLALGALLIGRVGEDTSVQQGTVRVGNHATDIPRTVRLAVGGGGLERLEVLLDVVLPVQRVTLVDGVDRPRLGQLHVRVGQDELAQAVVEGEAVDAAALHGDDQLGGGAVHGEAGGDQLSAGLEDVGLGALGALGQLVDGEDGADGDTSVEVGGAVDGVAGDGVAGLAALLEVDDVLLLLGHQQRALAARPHGLDEEVVGDHIEFLLLVTGRVGGAGQASEVDECCATDVVGDRLEGELKCVAEESRREERWY